MSNNLKALRKKRGFSRYGFARAMDVDPTTVWRWEQDDACLSNTMLIRIAKVLRVSPTDILPELAEVPPMAHEELTHVL